ncbi:MAG: class II fructose-bisphosphate aldolase family protein [Candidatus Pacebacteria bacterium]|nr:class II fructose-bisphosphate aldolase family protein [Candidatus Paceibacterota bacterium]
MTLIKKIIENAQEGNYAFGMFNTSNLEVTQAIARAAEEKNMPVLIGITESAVEYAGFLPIVNMVKAVIEESSADLVMHLDHGKNSEFVKKCIDAGFESVMIDASRLDFEKNIEVTKDIVDYAHERGVVVQAELGKIAKLDLSVESGVTLAKMEKTDPDELEEFVNRTGADTVAVIVGNIHGMYEAEGNPHLDLDLLQILRERVSTPFILHGGSGTPSEDVIRGIKECGIVSVNIDTEVRIAFVTALNDFFVSGQMVIDPRKVLSIARDAVQKKVGDKISLFGSL